MIIIWSDENNRIIAEEKNGLFSIIAQTRGIFGKSWQDVDVLKKNIHKKDLEKIIKKIINIS